MYSAFAAWGYSKKPSSRKSSRVVGGRGSEMEGHDHPQVSSLKIGVKTSQIVLSPVWCSKLRLTTAFHNSLFIDLLLKDVKGVPVAYHELVAGIVESRVRVLMLLKTRCVEGLTRVKSEEAQHPHLGMV
ncbi:hypothetical protein TNCV_865611 [Trichonephila clavipes]|nr:hypothetical protein TNCV_865611 [Trichonephila clavipes]